ncbi:MAG: type II toxin-antitoxin system CcdA family antitoxin [Desulfuromonadales bacterium]|jgi:antitoxin CcdA
MKILNAYNHEASKKAVNLTANSDLLRIAKSEGFNLSQVFEEALAERVRKHLEEQWLAENREAITHYNARIEKDGVFAARKRRF